MIWAAKLDRCLAMIRGSNDLHASTPGDSCWDDRQCAGVVRLCDLRLLRCTDRPSLLSARGCRRPTPFDLWHFCGRVFNAPCWRRDRRAYRRHARTPRGANLFPVGLTLLRVVQGLSVGGEYPGSMVFLVEHAPEGQRGLMGALGASGGTVGMLLGSAVGAAFSASMSTAALDAWGWRIPFLLGLVVGVAGYILRQYALETTIEEKRTRAPIVETLHHWRVVARFAGLSVYSAVTFYIGFVYLVSWLQTADGIPPSRSLEINSFSMLSSVPVLIAVGWLSDRIGRKPLMLLASTGGLIGGLPLFWLLNHQSDLVAQVGQLGLVLLTGAYYGSLPAVLVEAAPPSVRCTAVALGYNLCTGLFGGLSPLVATWLVERTGDETAPAFLIMASAAVTLVTLFWFRETYRKPFIVGPSRTAPP